MTSRGVYQYHVIVVMSVVIVAMISLYSYQVERHVPSLMLPTAFISQHQQHRNVMNVGGMTKKGNVKTSLKTPLNESQVNIRQMMALKSTALNDIDEMEKKYPASVVNNSKISSKYITNCIKQIQYWGPFAYTLADGEYNCPEEHCTVRLVHSNTYEKLATSHAVILHHKGSWEIKQLVSHRPNWQIWIYSSKESPMHSRSAYLPVGLNYNWTMTYRIDSDIVNPYGRYFENIPEVKENDNRNWAAGKTGKVAWLASNCHISSWNRNDFVKHLQQNLEVDMYGQCGTKKCPRGNKCDAIINSHKFYLALENSECQDYITEKFWLNALLHNLIPIVYGTTREDYEKVAPPNSFVHLSDFPNIKALGDYIKFLDKNDTAYNKYFEWRKVGSVKWYREDEGFTTATLCNIVKKLKEVDEMKRSGNVKESGIINMSKWWKPSCKHLKSVWRSK